MTKKKWWLIIVVVIAGFALFATVVIMMFNYISDNPIDTVAMSYLAKESGMQEEYGEILSIGRHIYHKTIKEESTIKAPYSVTTESGRVIVYVTLVKNDEAWVADSWEVIEVIPNEYQS